MSLDIEPGEDFLVLPVANDHLAVEPHAAADKAEFARIGRYYATESMLVWDAQAGRYDADATPSTGTQTLWDCYASLVREGASLERGDHAVF